MSGGGERFQFSELKIVRLNHTKKYEAVAMRDKSVREIIGTRSKGNEMTKKSHKMTKIQEIMKKKNNTDKDLTKQMENKKRPTRKTSANQLAKEAKNKFDASFGILEDSELSM